MNYPIWEIPTIGGASLIALIAIFHVYIAHLAVGGGLFIWLTDWKGFRENDADIHAYVYKHTWFFLLLTMVFGGVTGVGIWFIIALVHPAATSALIHSFVFGWAIEWVFFVGEIVALLVYSYKFKVLSRKNRLILAFLYALFAWLSLVIINGILSFMLTPGAWLQTNGFWDGFFNPTYFSSLLFRSFIAMIIAGLFGYVTVVFLKDSDFRTKMMRYCSYWLLLPAIGAALTGVWYYYAVPAGTRFIAFDLNAQTQIFMQGMLVTSVLVVILGALFMLKMPRTVQQLLVFVLVIIGLGWMGSFEYVREIARKPFVIQDFMYSTSIHKADMERLNTEGVLSNAKWSAVKQVTAENKLQAGKEMFNIQCLNCHTIDGIRNDILPQTDLLTYMGTLSHITGQGKLLTYMPPVVGTPAEKEALAAYVVSELHGRKIQATPTAASIEEKETHVPEKPADYVLLAWNDKGMACISDSDPWFTILPPGNTIEAQLIQRGDSPVIITEGVEMTYKVQEGHENPANHSKFWEYSESLVGKKLEPNVGTAGNGLTGTFHENPDLNSFIAKKIPVLAYRDDGTFNPYPLFTIEARDAETGELLASTEMVAPTTTEMGCKNCHGGEWKFDNRAGVSDETARNILTVHDRINGTSLLAEAEQGQPKSCKSCHGAEDRPELLSTSAAIHGFHANYMFAEGKDACVLCHPAYAEGATRCARSIHSRVGVTCVDCHGEIADHALALLKGQPDANSASRLMANLSPKAVASVDDINPRLAWDMQPDCLNCHVDFEQPAADYSGFNQWTEGLSDLYRQRFDDTGSLRCEACHNSPHAEYPATNPYGAHRDNVQPLQYSNMPFPIGSNTSCTVCHTVEMDFAIHHENMVRPFRNAALFEEQAAE